MLSKCPCCREAASVFQAGSTFYNSRLSQIGRAVAYLRPPAQRKQPKMKHLRLLWLILDNDIMNYIENCIAEAIPITIFFYYWCTGIYSISPVALDSSACPSAASPPPMAHQLLCSKPSPRYPAPPPHPSRPPNISTAPNRKRSSSGEDDPMLHLRNQVRKPLKRLNFIQFT